MPRRRVKRTRGNFISVRLSPEDDADLVEWWATVPQGSGGEIVKQAIRELLSRANGQQPATTGDVKATGDELKRAIAILAAQVNGLDKRIAAGVVVAGAAQQTDGLSSEEQQQRLNNVLNAGW